MTPARGKKRSDIPRCLLCSKASFLYVGVADNGGPARDFALDESAELIWSHVFRGEALLAQQVDRIGCMHCLFRRRGKLIDHGTRRARGRKQAKPKRGVEVRDSRFRHGRHVR